MPDVLEEIYNESYAEIQRYLAVRTRDADLGHDLAQTVFLKIAGALKKDGGDEAIRNKAYLFTIARNTLFDHYRKQKNAPVFSDEAVELFAETNGWYDPIRDRDDKEQVRELLGKVHKPRERAAIEMRYLWGFSTDEIIAEVGTTDQGVRQLLTRGLRRMRDESIESVPFIPWRPKIKMSYYFNKEKNIILEVSGDVIYEFLPMGIKDRPAEYRKMPSASASDSDLLPSLDEIATMPMPEKKTRKSWDPETKERHAARMKEFWAKRREAKLSATNAQ